MRRRLAAETLPLVAAESSEAAGGGLQEEHARSRCGALEEVEDRGGGGRDGDFSTAGNDVAVGDARDAGDAGDAVGDDADSEAARTAMNILGRSKGVAILAPCLDTNTSSPRNGGSSDGGGGADYVVERLRLGASEC